jgi:hypothetical protein
MTTDRQRDRRDWKKDVNMELTEVGCDYAGWVNLAQGSASSQLLLER